MSKPELKEDTDINGHAIEDFDKLQELCETMVTKLYSGEVFNKNHRNVFIYDVLTVFYGEQTKNILEKLEDNNCL